MYGHGHRRRREFLSPFDTIHEDVVARQHEDALLARLPSTPDSPSLLSPVISTPSRDILSVEAVEQQLRDRALQTQVTKVRRYSDQDLKTRFARANVLPAQSHRSTRSYPFHSPSQMSDLSHASLLPSPTGVVKPEMEAPRLRARPVSTASSRSSFGSRPRDSLSTSSLVNYQSSRMSLDSSYSAGAKLASLASGAPSPTTFTNGRRSSVEPISPAYARDGAGGRGRPQSRMTLVVPQRLSNGPTNQSFSSWTRLTPNKPGEGFKKMPEEILFVILAELKRSHLEVGSLSCSTCWMRDLISLGFSCRKWWNAAKAALYQDIQLNGADSVHHVKKRFKVVFGTRLKLLRRTLRARPDIAQTVKYLKVPAMPDGLRTKKEQEEYVDLAASLIMACPNLERFHGVYPAYSHEFSRFAHALSTRKKLTERAWIINPSPFQRPKRYAFEQDSQFVESATDPGPLPPDQCIGFLTQHMKWPHLRTLFLHCNPGGSIDSLLFTDVFNCLPSLQHLHVSSFPASSFDDSTLTSLPPLRSLRLENLPGITATGLSNYAAATCSNALTHLSLISVPLLSLPVLARLFSHLVSLTHFTISQALSPALPIGIDIFLHPYLASSTLQYLHWELTNPDDDTATQILGKSISFKGFPALRTLRVPTDFDGILQKLCKPCHRIEQPGDRYRNMGLLGSQPGLSYSHSLPNMPLSLTHPTVSLGHDPNSGFVKSYSRSTFSLNLENPHNPDSYNIYSSSLCPSMSLASARLMAQTRLESAFTRPKFHIIVWDENGQFVERFAVGGFIGDLQSKISYSLKPDIYGMDEAVASINGHGGLLDGSKERNVRDGCTGSWNRSSEELGKSRGKVCRKDSEKDRSWHTERARWTGVDLARYF